MDHFLKIAGMAFLWEQGARVVMYSGCEQPPAIIFGCLGFFVTAICYLVEQEF